MRDATRLPILLRLHGSPADALNRGRTPVCPPPRSTRTPNGLSAGTQRPSNSAWSASSRCATPTSSSTRWSASIRRSSCSLRRESGRGEDPLDNVLDLLADVPAGKLAIADLEVTTPDEVAELERAGVDAVIVASAAPRWAGSCRPARSLSWPRAGGAGRRSRWPPAGARGCAPPHRDPVRAPVSAPEPRRAERRPASLVDEFTAGASIRTASTSEPRPCTCWRRFRRGRTSRPTSRRA